MLLQQRPPVVVAAAAIEHVEVVDSFDNAQFVFDSS